MIMWLRRWVGTPDLGDAELNRQASLVRRILLVLFPTTAGFVLALLIFTPDNVSGRNMSVAAFIIEGITLWMLRRGRVRFAGMGMLLALWVCMTLSIYLGEGVRSVAVLGQMLVIFMAGLLVNASFASNLTLLTILGNYIIFLLHSQQGQQEILLDARTYWITQSIFFAIALGLTLVYAKRLQQAFDEAQAKEDSLKQQVSELHIVKDAQTAEEARLRRREAILQVASGAAERLFRQHSFAEGMLEVLHDLGQASGADRVRVFENANAASDNLMAHEVYVWAASHVPEYMRLGRFKSVHFREAGLLRWVDLLSNNQAVRTLVKNLPDLERCRLQSQGLISVLIIPIFVGDTWWGSVGFDEIKTEREWTQDEEDALRTAAGILGAAIERQRIERALNRSQQHYLAILQDQTDMICRYTPEGHITFVNEAYERFFDLPSQPPGRERLVWQQMQSDEEAQILRSKIDSITPEHPATTSRNLTRRTDGSLRWIEWISRGIFDENGLLVEVQAAGRDVDNEVRLREQLERNLRESETQAMTDALTGLLNRRAISERAEIEWERALREGQPFSLVLIDLDHLKEINDTHGHLMGDEALKVVGNLLKTSMRRNDWAGRWGGDEFMLLLPGAEQQVAVQVAERLRQRIGQARLPVQTGAEVALQISLGVVSSKAGNGSAETLDTLFAKADQALYGAKQAGRNRVGVT